MALIATQQQTTEEQDPFVDPVPRFHPCDHVWTLVEGGVRQLRIIRVDICLRSVLDNKYVPNTSVIYTLEDGRTRKEDELYESNPLIR